MVTSYLAGVATVVILVLAVMVVYSYINLKKLSKEFETFYNNFDQSHADMYRVIHSESKNFRDEMSDMSKDLKEEMNNIRSYIDQVGSEVTKLRK